MGVPHQNKNYWWNRFFDPKSKRGSRGSLRSDFDKMSMDFPRKMSLILKIIYPHLAGGQRAPKPSRGAITRGPWAPKVLVLLYCKKTYQKPRTKLSVLLLLRDSCLQRFYLHKDFSLLGPPLNIWLLKTFACVSIWYRKRHWVVGDNKTKSQEVKK